MGHVPALYAALALVLAGGSQAFSGSEDVWSKTPQELLKGIENAHPSTYYVVASRLFASGRKDEAVFWFYAGQLRYRFHLKANPNLPPDGDPALFASVSESVGRPLNEYAFGRLETLRQTLERVLAWDEKTGNGFTSKTQHAADWKGVRSGLGQLLRTIEEQKEQIRRQRTQHGLPNEE